MVARFAEEISKKKPGKNWVARFVKSSKEELASGFLTGFDLTRKKADNVFQYQRYFDLVSDLLSNVAYINVE